MNIAVAGTGYVGLSLAVLLSQNHHVSAVDVVPQKVEMLREVGVPHPRPRDRGVPGEGEERGAPARPAPHPGRGGGIPGRPSSWWCPRPRTTTRRGTSSTPPSVEAGDRARCSRSIPKRTMVVKSTVPVGYAESAVREAPAGALPVLPRVPARGQGALRQPAPQSRIVVGVPKEVPEGWDARAAAEGFAGAFSAEGARGDRTCPTLVMGSTEAEAVKLFANTYLALRVAYFNELDTYAEARGLDASRIIEGVCARPPHRHALQQPLLRLRRLLPAQGHQAAARQLRRTSRRTSSAAIVDANRTRKDFVADEVLEAGRGVSGPRPLGGRLPPHDEERARTTSARAPSRAS